MNNTTSTARLDAQIEATRPEFEATVIGSYQTPLAGAVRRVDFPGSVRLGMYVAHHIEFAWGVWKHAMRARLASRDVAKLRESALVVFGPDTSVEAEDVIEWFCSTLQAEQSKGGT